MECEVAVIGSCMIDLICYAERLPQPGETLRGTKFLIGQGGKGANQCVAAAKLGSKSALIAKLGNDTFGKEYKQILTSLGVNTQYVTLTEGYSSGMAQITVSQEGENQIVIVPGANNSLTLEDVQNAKSVLASCKVVLFQLEIPIDTSIQAMEYIKMNYKDVLIILNAAPATKTSNPKLFCLPDVFCVNETEAEDLGNLSVKNIEEAKLAVKALIDKGCKTVIITLGAKGAVFGSSKVEPTLISIPPSIAVDTTGAGDAFLGAFAYFSSRFSHLTMKDIIKRSCAVASWSVTKEGTQSSYPTKPELPEELFS